MSRPRSSDEGWSLVEQQICDAVPAPLQHEPDASDEWNWYDATFSWRYNQEKALPIRGADSIEQGTRCEIKTCQRWQENGEKRRRGRFSIHSQNHEKRVEEEAVYLFGLREPGVATLATAKYVHAFLKADDRWTTGDNDHPGERSANIGWPNFISEERVSQ